MLYKLLKIILLISTVIEASYFLTKIKKQLVVYPKFHSSIIKKRKDLKLNVFYEYEEKIETIDFGHFVLKFKNNDNFGFAQNFVVNLIRNESGVSENIEKPNCRFLTGHIDGSKLDSSVSVCGDKVRGLLITYDGYYFVEPTKKFDNSHIMLQSEIFKSTRKRRDLGVMCGTTEFVAVRNNITKDDPLEENIVDDEEVTKEVIGNLTWRKDKLEDDELLGYFYDSAWEAHYLKKRKRPTISTPRRWLEIAIGVDHSVISFHGLNKVQHYILALMNIVSAIYQDPSLESNLQLVITRMVLYDNKRFNLIKERNATRSLENVNAWNRKLHSTLLPGEPRHDLAIWLTRLDLGGPSGYAPVGGACNPGRSCTLNRDEGLTSSFIIAHEMAHVLGLTHDGDKKSGNNCGQEAQDGSVMAPMVAATFNRFSWSTCSKKEFHQKISSWPCLMNPPSGFGEHVLQPTLYTTFTMDEQCRIEFGDGYGRCTSLDMTEPCFHLWCGHYASPLICKTKKGPPLEGTECGLDKWCINGYCKNVDVHNDKIKVDPVVHNPQDGGWSIWTQWQPCSRSCGFGVQFRTRECNNPKPVYGGNDCQGSKEEFRICAKIVCPEPLKDIRAEQCKRLNKIVNFDGTPKQNMTWLPYEPKEASLKCRIICQSRQTSELHFTNEQFLDGTPCSYDESNSICIQGECQKLGCDGSFAVNKNEDWCGVCNGDNSQCKNITAEYQRNIRKETSRVLILPRLSRNIIIECNITTVRDPLDNLVKLHLKDRRKQRYDFINEKEGTLIIKGAKFTFKRQNKYMKIWAKGPLLAELIVSLYAPSYTVNSGIGMTVKATYTVPKTNVTRQTRYVWELGGWGPCSTSCGGGRRQKTVACRDKLTRSIVPRRKCPLSEKPTLTIQECNSFSCRFHWQPGEWEYCSDTCGFNGIQHRELYCVHHLSNSSEPWKHMVKPDRCPIIQPETVRACNRIPCPTYWQRDGWSQCSSTCGTGVRKLLYTCPAPQNQTFICGSEPEGEIRPCRGSQRKNNILCRKRKRAKCISDASEYCILTDLLSKYCILPQYKKICCKSCANSLSDR